MLAVANAGFCIGPQTKIGHVTRRYRRFISVPMLSARGIFLVRWCFEPSQPQKITSGLNTNFSLSPNHSFHKSSYRKSFLFCFSLYVFREHSTREPASGRPILLSWPTQEPCVSYSQHRRNRERFWKNAGEWTGMAE